MIKVKTDDRTYRVPVYIKVLTPMGNPVMVVSTRVKTFRHGLGLMI